MHMLGPWGCWRPLCAGWCFPFSRQKVAADRTLHVRCFGVLAPAVSCVFVHHTLKLTRYWTDAQSQSFTISKLLVGRDGTMRTTLLYLATVFVQRIRLVTMQPTCTATLPSAICSASPRYSGPGLSLPGVSCPGRPPHQRKVQKAASISLPSRPTAAPGTQSLSQPLSRQSDVNSSGRRLHDRRRRCEKTECKGAASLRGYGLDQSSNRCRANRPESTRP